MNKQLNKKDVVAFLKKYGYIVVLSVIMLVTAIVMAVIVNNTDGTQETGGTPNTTFTSPILNAVVAKGYSDSALMYNSTLKQWEAHRAVTFTVAAPGDVFAVLDGKVLDVYSNYLDGTVVVIEHAGGLTSVYGSLSEEALVKVGDTVARGSVIGKASNTANAEVNLGTHLRYQLLQNGQIIDPTTHLNLELK